MTAATTTDHHHNRGLFKKMNLRKSMMRNNKKSSGSGTGTGTSAGTNPVEPELVSRRVVKATPVPTDANINPAIVPSSENNNNQDGMEDEGSSGQHGGDIALRSVQDETLREKTEQWRQERLDASAAIRKENKEKEVLEHRHRESSGVRVVVSGSKSSESLNTLPVVEVPAVLTVASEFPEHKRKIRTNNHHDGGKKSRVDDGSGGGGVSASSGKDTARAVVDEEEGEKDWKATAVDAIKRSAAPAAIVAVVAIVAMSLLRSKR